MKGRSVMAPVLLWCLQASGSPAESPEEFLRTAEALIQQQNFADAAKVLDSAARTYPESASILYKRGYVYFRQRALASAKSNFLALVQLTPPALHSRYFLGRIALLEGHPAEAISWLKPAAAATPPIFDAAAQLGKAYLDANQLKNARAATEAALEQTPWDGSLHYRLARIYQQLGEAELAKREFAATQRSKALDEGSVEKLVECSEHLSKGENAEALKVRGELLEEKELDPDVLVALGAMLGGAGLHQESLEPFQLAALRQPDLFQAHYNAGLALLRLGRPQDAETPLQKSVALLPQSAEANSALALSYVLRGQYQPAVAPLETVHRQEPENTLAASLLGTAYLRSGAPAKAVLVLKQAAAANTKDANTHFLLIEALNATEDQQGALAVAEETLRLFPTLPRAYLANAQQLARVGRYQQAGPLFAKAVELEPAQIESLLGLAEVQQKAGDYAASLGTYQRVLALEGNNLTATLGSGKDLVQLRRVEEARDLLEKAATHFAGEPQIHIELSRVYARLGDSEKAAEQTRILQQLGPKQ